MSSARTLIPFMKTLTLGTNHLPKSPSRYMIALVIRFHYMNFHSYKHSVDSSAQKAIQRRERIYGKGS